MGLRGLPSLSDRPCRGRHASPGRPGPGNASLPYDHVCASPYLVFRLASGDYPQSLHRASRRGSDSGWGRGGGHRSVVGLLSALRFFGVLLSVQWWLGSRAPTRKWICGSGARSRECNGPFFALRDRPDGANSPGGIRCRCSRLLLVGSCGRAVSRGDRVLIVPGRRVFTRERGALASAGRPPRCGSA